jgi:hypothetical protein
MCKKCGDGVIVVREGARVIARCRSCDFSTVVFTLAGVEGEEDELREEEIAKLDQVNPSARALYEYLRRYHHRYGYAPALREMRVAVGWSSVNSVRHYLSQLEEVGLIERDFAAARGIRLPLVA